MSLDQKTIVANNIPPHQDENGRTYREIRCANCHSLLGYEMIRKGRIMIKCPKTACAKITVMTFKPREAAGRGSSAEN